MSNTLDGAQGEFVAVLGLDRRTGEASSLPFPVHPHMLRHACGYKLANDGQDT